MTNNEVVAPMNPDFSKFICPVCGKKDIEMYATDLRRNYYRCLLTGKSLEFEVESHFIEKELGG